MEIFVKMTYEEQLLKAAQNWKNLNPKAEDSLNKIACEIATNNAKYKQEKPCEEFDYSGTIWCDRCGFESEEHKAC